MGARHRYTITPEGPAWLHLALHGKQQRVLGAVEGQQEGVALCGALIPAGGCRECISNYITLGARLK